MSKHNPLSLVGKGGWWVRFILGYMPPSGSDDFKLNSKL
ncbi:hypothetical protein COO91_06688 [Nostoc flagelliforme CCNUN1]|uniref:Uncharacterized protein n=1 Tax=Nostoc flagelliforme CCNUN1 TaxID=2038116 RepID=A0A2K8SZ14_9NOSO|nr:hypothetical protein COO91_06688 [Nostoc flagelliforme CCNUN1]